MTYKEYKNLKKEKEKSGLLISLFSVLFMLCILSIPLVCYAEAIPVIFHYKILFFGCLFLLMYLLILGISFIETYYYLEESSTITFKNRLALSFMEAWPILVICTVAAIIIILTRM